MSSGLVGRDVLAAVVLDVLPERVARYRFADRVVVYCNEAWAAGHGLTPAEATGRCLDDLLSPVEREGLRSQLARLTPDTPLLADPEPRTAPENPEIWVEWVDQLVPGPDGDEVFAVGRDITARHLAQRQLRASEQRFRQAMANAPIGMELVGLDGGLLEVNAAFCRFLGRSESELLRMTWQEITHPDDLAADARMVTGLLAGEFPAYTVEKRYLHADGSTRWGLLTGTFVRADDGTPLYGIAQVVDITDRKRAEEQAERRASLLRTAGAVARVGGWAWDRGSAVISWSDVVCEILGYPVGTQLQVGEALALALEGDRARIGAAIEACLQDGTPWDIEHGVLTRAGEERRVRTVGHAEVDEQGEVTRVWGAFQDITQLRRVQQEADWLAEQLTSTLESVEDGVMTVDNDFTITYANRRAAQMAGRATDALVGRNLWEQLPELAATPAYAAYRQAIVDGTPVSIERHHDERSSRWLDLEAYPSVRGGLTIYVRDVSHHVEREQVLERALAAERAAVEQLRELDRAKTAFLSAVSHELRTPLTVVYGLASSLQRLRGGMAETVRTQLEDAVVTHADHLRELLDDLLDIDRLARGQLEAARTPFDVAATVRAVIAGTSSHGRTIVEAPTTLLVRADQVQVERITTNLLDNAAKYAPEGRITVRLREREGGGFRLEIEDEGPGIPPAELERVFEPFHRIDDQHPQPGTGIGLALVADFARIHDGHAWAEDADGTGVRFVIEIPDGDAD